MFWNIRLWPALLLAVAVLTLAACGGGGSSDDSGDAGSNSGNGSSSDGGNSVSNDDGDSSGELVLNGAEALGKSAASFSDGVSSVSGDFEFSFAANEISVDGSADFAFESPDRMHMTMSIDGGSQESVIDLSEFGKFEFLARDGEFYINIPFLGGWFEMSAEDLGADGQSIEEMMSQSAVFDYAGFLEDLPGDVEFLGEEQVNGHNTAHYRFSGNIGDFIDSFSNSLASSGEGSDLTEELLNGNVDGPLDVDVWVGTEDNLPYMLMLGASLNTAQGPFTLSMTGNFDDYNGDVDIPEAPDDAQSFADMFGGLIDEPPAAPTDGSGY